MSKKIKKTIPIILALVLILTPSLNYRAGSIFFGDVGVLYNVNLAHLFFKISTLSIFGKTYPYANYQLSRINFIKGNLDESIKYATRELEEYPDHCRTHYIRGLTYGYMDKIDEAIQDFETFNRSCVKNSWAGHNDLAWLYFRKGDIQKMVNVIEPMAKMYPNNPWVLNTYGVGLLNLGDFTMSRIVLSEARRNSYLTNEKEWGSAYPGNNPSVYKKGLLAMRGSIEKNLFYTYREEFFASMTKGYSQK